MRVVNDSGLPDVVAPGRHADAGRAPARVDAGLPAGQPLLRDRPAVRHRVAAVRQRPDRLGARAGDLRLRPPAHRVRLPACAPHAHGLGGLQGGAGRLPRLRPPGHRVLPLHEHSRRATAPATSATSAPSRPTGPMDFAGWFEAYLGDRWYTFDARNNTPRIGRVLIARGRDACDVALASTFGPNTLERFKVWTDEVSVI